MDYIRRMSTFTVCKEHENMLKLVRKVSAVMPVCLLDKHAPIDDPWKRALGALAPHNGHIVRSQSSAVGFGASCSACCRAEHKDWTSFVAGIRAATSATSSAASFYRLLQGPALASMSPDFQNSEPQATSLKPRSSAWVFHSASTGEPSHFCSASLPLLLRAATRLGQGQTGWPPETVGKDLGRWLGR